MFPVCANKAIIYFQGISTVLVRLAIQTMYINFKIQVSVFICIILAISRMILDRMLEDTVLESALMSASLIGEYILPPSLHSSYDTKDIEWSKLFRAEYKNILNELYEFEEKV
eukprot:520318_1